MKGRVRPYLIADDTTVVIGGWEYRSGDTWEPLADAVAEWDYNTDLTLRTTLTADVEALRNSAQLALDAPLLLSVSWRCPDGRVGYTAATVALDASVPDAIQVTLPGERLGPEIDLAVRVVLAADTPAALPGAAHLAGSVLWEHITNVLLVGVGGRFPVMVVDFAASGLDDEASWVLDVPDDLDTPVQGSLVLLINANDADLVAAASGKRKDSTRLLDDLHEQVAVQLLDHAVVHADELVAGDWADTSLGATLAILTARCDGGVASMSALREAHPAAYRARLVGEARRNGFGRPIR